jgi:arylsulfatase A-like enzyme
MGDDVGWDDVGFHGSNNVLTPNIDVLAADGIIINDYYTSPLCTPSRSAFLSGVHPIDSGDQHFVIVNGEPRGFSLEFPLLPQILKRNENYTTHLIGKWNLGFYKTIYTPNFRGFDSFYGYYGNKIDYFTHEGESGDKIGLDWRNDLVPERTEGGQYATYLLTQRAMDLIKGHDSRNPLFMQISFPNTHVGNSKDPNQAPRDHENKFNILIPDKKKATYAANLFSMDESVGMIIHSLHIKGLLSNSIVVFLSDNGSGDRGIFPNGGSNFPLRGVKSTLFEGGIRVPAFIWSPLLKQNSYVFEGLFHVSDWFPTILSAVSSETHKASLTDHESKSIYGISMWESLSQRRPSPRQHILHNIDPIERVSSLRVGKYKLVSGVVDSDLSGWYGDRVDINVSTFRTSSDSQSFVFTLREESLTRRTLAMIGRAPSYNNFDKTTITCHKPTRELKRLTPCNPEMEECLFNIEEDPCEVNNLARDNAHALILREMRRMVKQFESRARKPRTQDVDPASDPRLHNGVWVPWKDVSFLRLRNQASVISHQWLFSSTILSLSVTFSILFMIR